jgi:hypothetical protein
MRKFIWTKPLKYRECRSLDIMRRTRRRRKGGGGGEGGGGEGEGGHSR